MAIQSFQLDPDHTHTYKNLTSIFADSHKNLASPVFQSVDQGNNTTFVWDGSKTLYSIGVKTEDSETGSPT